MNDQIEVSPRQPLAKINGTMGHFEDQYQKRIYYTEDRQGRAQNVVIGDYQLSGFGKKPYLKDITEFSAVVVIDVPDKISNVQQKKTFRVTIEGDPYRYAK